MNRLNQLLSNKAKAAHARNLAATVPATASRPIVRAWKLQPKWSNKR